MSDVSYCGLCCNQTELVYAGHPGYRVGTRFDIYLCRSCDTAQALPRIVDTTLYDEVYAFADALPGYERYVRHQRAVLTAAKPLDYLATAEDVYWSVRERLKSRGGQAKGLRVLEAGSGLGYLTYALARSGYDVTGVDVSLSAVEQASANFGDIFEQADVGDFAARNRGTFDIVVMTELIEHLPNFKEVLVDALQALTPRGELVVTTPNKSSFDPGAVWATENPPVHLWWFSEQSMRVLAHEIGCAVRFVNFVEFNRLRRPPGGFIDSRRQRTVPFYPPSLARDGGPVPSGSLAGSQRPRLRGVLDTLKLTDAALELRYRTSLRLNGVSSRRPNMCAVFSIEA